MTDLSPFVDLDRDEWSELAESTPLPLTEEELARLAGLGDPIDLDEVAMIYLPLSRLLNLYSAGIGMLHTVTSTFLRERSGRTPFVIGVAGSVAVGKSTTARVLRQLLARWHDTPRVELVTTDGFLYPNKILEQRNLMHRKGFPESYDRRALLQFMARIKSGAPEASTPRYDHLIYDIVPGEHITIHKPDILIVEGLNVLQPARVDEESRNALAVSDFFDFGVYVDAEVQAIESWYIKRFLRLRHTAFADPDSYFHRYSTLTDDQAVDIATQLWRSINEPNLVENILPTRGRANLVLTKGADHAVTHIRLRKL